MKHAAVVRALPGPRLAAGVAAGAAVLAVGAVAGPAVVALDLVWLAALMIAAVADWRGRGAGVDVERLLPTSICIGEEARVAVRVESLCSYPLRLEISDSPPPEIGAGRRRLCVSLEAMGRAEAGYSIVPTRRGIFRFGGISVRIPGRFGLVTCQATIPGAREVRVLPGMRPAREHDLLARQDRRNLMGLRENRLRGSGVEFHSLRDWASGDDMRRVDWKATARRGKLIARDYEFERNQNIILALDLGRTMASRIVDPESGMLVSKADCAVNACVLLAWVATQARDQVGLAAFSSGLRTFVPPGSGPAQYRKLIHALTPLEPEPEEPDYGQVFLRLARSARRRSLIVLFTDLIDPGSADSLLRSLQHLAPRHLALVVAISDYELRDLLTAVPVTQEDVFRQTVAATMISDRKRVLASLEARGVLTLDAAPSDLSVAAVNRYLEIKRSGRL